jgi:hypothetical protein
MRSAGVRAVTRKWSQKRWIDRWGKEEMKRWMNE